MPKQININHLLISFYQFIYNIQL